MENQPRQTVLHNSEDRLLCKSQPADLKSIYRVYAVITMIVVAFQLFLFSRHLFNIFQLLIVAVFLVSVVYYVLKTRRDAGEYLYLYETHYETGSGSFRYQDIQDMEAGKCQLILKTGKKATYYVSNADELAKIIRARRQKT